MLEKKTNILYIEDDQAFVILVKKYLETPEHRAIFNIIHKDTLGSAVEYLRSNSHNVDVILLDLVLPNSKGVSTFQTIVGECDFLPIVILSGYDDLAHRCVELGAQDCLIKPDISASLLIRAIYYSIARKKIETDHKRAEEILRREEKDMYNSLEVKINEWREEIKEREARREEQFKRIDKELLSISNGE